MYRYSEDTCFGRANDDGEEEVAMLFVSFDRLMIMPTSLFRARRERIPKRGEHMVAIQDGDRREERTNDDAWSTFH